MIRSSTSARPVVLVADDDEEMRAFLVHVLEDEGYDVLIAEDGVQALRVLSSREVIDVLVTDHRMPRCTGIELVDALRSTGSRLGVVLLTSFPDAAVEAEARRLGAHAVVCKPFPIRQLLQAVHEIAWPTWRTA